MFKIGLHCAHTLVSPEASMPDRVHTITSSCTYVLHCIVYIALQK